MQGAPATWLGAILCGLGEPLRIVELVAPALRSGQVLVQVLYSGVCRSQVMEVRGLRGEDPWLPHLLGHEAVGYVVEVGKGVTKVAPGDRVVLGWIVGRGLQADSPKFKTTDGETVNAGSVTTFSEWTIVSENRVYACPTTVDDQTAVLFGCAFLTGAGMVLNELWVEPRDWVLINGLGGIGTAALLAARSRGSRIVVADPNAAKRAQALALGAELAIDPTVSTDVSECRRIVEAGFKHAVDSSGTTSGIEWAFSMIRDTDGTLLFASHPPAGDQIRLDAHALIRGRQIRGSWGGGSRPDDDIPRIAKILDEESTDLEFMFPKIYSLGEINDALIDLEEGRAFRPLIRLGGAG